MWPLMLVYLLDSVPAFFSGLTPIAFACKRPILQSSRWLDLEVPGHVLYTSRPCILYLWGSNLVPDRLGRQGS